MQRRNFLINSGILASAIIASPSSVWAADKKNKAAFLIIRDDSADARSMINSIIKTIPGQPVHELAEEQVSDMIYSSDGFLVTMNNGKTYLAEKIIFSSYKKIDVSGHSVNIKTENKNIPLRFDAANNAAVPAPEFWSLTAKKFDNGKIKPFIKRNKHAFLCIS